MDKYQQFYIDKAFGRDKILKKVFVDGGEEVCGEIDLENLTITVKQKEDITVTKYKAVINAWTDMLVIKGVEVKRKGGKWEKFEPCEYTQCRGIKYEIPLDFENRITEVKLIPSGNLVDDVILKVVYSEADKDAYYKKKAEAELQEYIKKAHLEYETCISFLNVFFTPCSEDYGGSEVTLYRDRDQFMAKYQSVPGQFCITALGLGFGNYCFIYRQFDQNRKPVFETGKINVVINDRHIRQQLY